jgi:hypothetical protein
MNSKHRSASLFKDTPEFESRLLLACTSTSGLSKRRARESNVSRQNSCNNIGYYPHDALIDIRSTKSIETSTICNNPSADRRPESSPQMATLNPSADRRPESSPQMATLNPFADRRPESSPQMATLNPSTKGRSLPPFDFLFGSQGSREPRLATNETASIIEQSSPSNANNRLSKAAYILPAEEIHAKYVHIPDSPQFRNHQNPQVYLRHPKRLASDEVCGVYNFQKRSPLLQPQSPPQVGCTSSFAEVSQYMMQKYHHSASTKRPLRKQAPPTFAQNHGKISCQTSTITTEPFIGLSPLARNQSAKGRIQEDHESLEDCRHVSQQLAHNHRISYSNRSLVNRINFVLESGSLKPKAINPCSIDFVMASGRLVPKASMPKVINQGSIDFVMESGQPKGIYRCSRCQRAGHNYRTCTQNKGW